MSTPESKLEVAATNVTNALSKVKSIWQHWEMYFIAAVCLVVGAVVGHKVL